MCWSCGTSIKGILCTLTKCWCHAALNSPEYDVRGGCPALKFRNPPSCLHSNPKTKSMHKKDITASLYLYPGQSDVHPNFETRKIGTNCSEREVRMAANRVFTSQFRQSIVERVLKGQSVGVLSQELNIGRSVLYRWCDSYRREGVAGIERGTGRPPHRIDRVAKPKQRTDSAEVARCKVAELERRLGRMTLENDFLKRAFKRVKEAHSKSNAPGDVRCTEK
jgi:transposase-like protein